VGVGAGAGVGCGFGFLSSLGAAQAVLDTHSSVITAIPMNFFIITPKTTVWLFT
jgi:hypothetical protein